MKIALISVVLILGFSVYWLGIRPGEIKKKCNSEASQQAKIQLNDAIRAANQGNLTIPKEYQELYDRCLRENGI